MFLNDKFFVFLQHLSRVGCRKRFFLCEAVLMKKLHVEECHTDAEHITFLGYENFISHVSDLWGYKSRSATFFVNIL